MACVENIEAAIGHHHPLTAQLRSANGIDQRRWLDHAELGQLVAMQRGVKLGNGERGGTRLGHHQARAQVGQHHGFRQRMVSGQGQAHQANHGIAGPRDIKHFLGTGGQVQRCLAFTNQRHALLTAGNQQRF